MNQTKPAIGRDTTQSIMDLVNLRALNATIDAVLAAEAGFGFDLAASKAKSLAGETLAAFGRVDCAAPVAIDRMAARICSN